MEAVADPGRPRQRRFSVLDDCRANGPAAARVEVEPHVESRADQVLRDEALARMSARCCTEQCLPPCEFGCPHRGGARERRGKAHEKRKGRKDPKPYGPC